MRAVAVLLLATLLGVVSSCRADRPPNVLLVSIDTLRADHLAAYGYERETSPALTRLAEEGARFANSYAQSSSTVPTHASLFTGRYPFQHGSYHVGLPVRAAERTLAERLQAAGYRTFGAASSVRFQGKTGFGQGFDTFEVYDGLPKNARSEAVTGRAIEEIGRGDGRPWFGFVHYFDPHQPYAPPEPYRTRWHPGLPRPRPEATSDYIYFHDAPAREVPPAVLEYLRALYDGEILFLDRPLGRLLGAVRSGSSEAGTIVVVTSDHGEEFKEHGGLSHAKQLHEELLRVPLFVWWPGRIVGGRVIDRPVASVDVLPTLLELAGLGPPEGVAGESRAGELLGRAESPEDGDAVVAEVKSHWSLALTIKGRRYKLLERPDGSHRLYDLTADIGGHVDVSAAHPDVLIALRERAADIGVGGERVALLAEPVPDEIRERLREIGYVDEVTQEAR